MMPAWGEAVLAVLAFLGVSGTIGPWIARRFHKGTEAVQEERLRVTFATQADFTAFRKSIEDYMEECCRTASVAGEASKLALKNADDGLDGVNELRSEQRRSNEALVERAIRPLENMAKEQNEMGKEVAGLKAMLTRVVAEIDRSKGAA